MKKRDIKVKIEGEVTQEMKIKYNEQLAKSVVEYLGIEESKKLLEQLNKEEGGFK